jgi:hypothetical protein
MSPAGLAQEPIEKKLLRDLLLLASLKFKKKREYFITAKKSKSPAMLSFVSLKRLVIAGASR